MLERSLKLSQKLGECIHACKDCFDSCLAEEYVKVMAQCIKLDKECSIICAATLQLIHKEGSFMKEVLELCIKACLACADECRKFPEEHCRECARVCDQCATTCREFIHHLN